MVPGINLLPSKVSRHVKKSLRPKILSFTLKSIMKRSNNKNNKTFNSLNICLNLNNIMDIILHNICLLHHSLCNITWVMLNKDLNLTTPNKFCNNTSIQKWAKKKVAANGAKKEKKCLENSSKKRSKTLFLTSQTCLRRKRRKENKKNKKKKIS